MQATQSLSQGVITGCHKLSQGNKRKQKVVMFFIFHSTAEGIQKADVRFLLLYFDWQIYFEISNNLQMP